METYTTSATRAWRATRREQQRRKAFGSAAIIQRRRARSTGTMVVVEDTHHRDAAADSDGGRWATICEDHGGVVNHDTQALAQKFAPCPEEWCPNCQERRAKVYGYDVTEERIERYLPSNYRVTGHGTDDRGDYVTIAGNDSHGWTLDSYVIPRLASGLWAAEEDDGCE